MNKLIKTNEEYAAALARLHSLLDADPERGSETANEVELLALLISTFEKEKFEFLPAPSPIDAIRFRMEQLDLAQKDIAKYLGSPSRVSEVLSGKRPLTLPMIRSLHEGLGIPANLLISEKLAHVDTEEGEVLDPANFPISEMRRRQWIAASSDSKRLVDELRHFISPVLPYAAAFKRTIHFRGTRNVDRYALIAWLARVWDRSEGSTTRSVYDPPNLTLDALHDLVRLSGLERGPLVAIDFLGQLGIRVTVEPPLPRTFLDGATLFAPSGPIIGLTLRFDRLDNFWYVLLHEIAHILLHSETASLFLDDLESGAVDDAEREADQLASEISVSSDAWKNSPASRVRSRQAAEHLARQLRISPAIVAGRIRRHYNDYKVLNDLVGHRAVRKLFPDGDWSAT